MKTTSQMGTFAVLGLSMLAGSGTAVAQGQSAERSAGLDEIIVTAQRRSEDLQDVPAAVTAIGSTQIENRGIRGFEDYLRTVPSVAFADLGNQSNEVKLRGVGVGSARTSPTTAIYLGEVPVIHTGRGLNSSYNFRLVDIERVEVLRGPQGQLYGSNSLGGAIKNVPAAPRFDAFSLSGGASGAQTHEGGDSYDVDLTFNVPVSDSFAFRATGYYAEQAGWYDNVYAGGRALSTLLPVPPLFQAVVGGQPVGLPGGPPWAVLAPAIPILPAPPAMGPPLRVVPGILGRNPALASYVAPSNAGEDVNSSEIYGGRVMLGWRASERFDANLMLAYEQKETEGTSWALEIPNVAGSVPGTFNYPRIGGATAIPVLYTSDARRFQQIGPAGGGNADEILLANLVLEFDLGFGTLTSSSSYWDRTENLATDLGVLAFRATSVSGTFPAIIERADNPKSYIQELRLTSNDDGPLRWLAGVFWQRLDQDFRIDVTDLSGVDILRLEQTVRNAVNGLPPPAAGPVGLQLGNYEDEQIAVFGELSYDFTDAWNAAVSFRWFDLEQTAVSTNTGFFYNTSQGTTSSENSDSVLTPKARVSWTPREDFMLYASASEGFRTGTTTPALPFNLCARELANAGFPNGTPPTEADTLWNYELGAKTSFADRRVVLNAAVYSIDWTDLQSQVFMAALKDPSVPVSSCTFETIFNVGDATIQGAELELSARLTEQLRLDATVAVTEPEYDSDYPQIGIRRGQTIEGTPDIQTFLGLQYDFNLFARPFRARVDWTHVGDIKPRGTDFQVQLQPYPIGKFDVVNFRLGFDLTEALKIDLFVDNVTDEFGVTRAIDLAGDSPPTIFTIRPRTAGLTLRWDFGGSTR